MKKIKLTRHKKAKVDDRDYEYLSQFKWCASRIAGHWYAYRCTRDCNHIRHPAAMHREILNLEHGDKRQVDHLNGDGLDNQRENLRIVTVAENAQNRPKALGFSKQRHKYRAKICVNGRRINLGCFNTPGEARAAYVAAKRIYHKGAPITE